MQHFVRFRLKFGESLMQVFIITALVLTDIFRIKKKSLLWILLLQTVFIFTPPEDYHQNRIVVKSKVLTENPSHIQCPFALIHLLFCMLSVCYFLPVSLNPK